MAEVSEVQDAFFTAVEAGDIGAATAALDAGADIDAKTPAGRTALMEAIDIADIDLARRPDERMQKMALFLITRGADVDARDGNGETALLHAARNDHMLDSPVVAVLLEKKADVNVQSLADGRSALTLAVMNSNKARVLALLEAGAVVDAPDEKGRTALSYAVYAEEPDDDVIKALVLRGADPDFVDKDSNTPRRLASFGGTEGVLHDAVEAYARAQRETAEAIEQMKRDAVHAAQQLLKKAAPRFKL